MQGGVTKEASRLRDVLQKAVERNNRAAAADALRELTAVEPNEARWPHRLGETLARLGRTREAEDAYEQAANLYAAQGFLARAIAVAKLAVELNPARAQLLETLDPQPAQDLRRENRPVTPASVVPVPAPLPTATPSTLGQPLEPHAAAEEDEIRFDDAPMSCTIEAQIVDYETSDLPDDDAFDPDAYLDADKLSRMSGATLFADIPKEALADLAHEAERVELADRDAIFAEGAPADALLVIVEGRAEVRRAGTATVELGEGEVLGESTLLEDATRSADVRARGPFVALRIRKPGLDRLVAEHARIGEVLFGLLCRRLVLNAFETSPLFVPFETRTRIEIARAFEVRRARAGTVLQEKGKKGDALYVVLSGVLEAAGDGGTERLLHGALIGHDALVTRAPSTRNVTVAVESILLRLPATKFSAFVTEYPPALAHLAELAAMG
jgi:cAMP-dependent protein kinase regulator